MAWQGFGRRDERVSLVLAAAMGAMAFGAEAPAAAHARMQASQLAAEVRSYAIPAGTIGMALNRLAEENGVQMVFLAGLTRNAKTGGLKGDYTLGAALDALLGGTGLTYRLADDEREVFIVLAQNDGVRNDAGGAEPLPPIDVGAEQSRVALQGQTSGKTGVIQPPNSKLQLDVQDSTASRLGLTPRETPSSIVVIDNATMRARGATTTQEALASAPGVITGSAPGAPGAVTMRGMGLTSVTQLFNGISVQYDAIAGRGVDNWLTDRVEVLGGPSSYLWGQGAVGGAINYVSKVANREQSGHEVFASGGMFFNRRVSYGYNGQVGDSDNWLQVAASYKGSDGYVDRTPHSSGAGSISWLTDITPNLSNLVAVEFQAEERDAYWGTPVLNPAFGEQVLPWATVGLPVFTGQIDGATRYKNYNATNPVFDQQVLWTRNITDYRIDDATQIKNTFYFYNADRQYTNVEVYRWNATNTLINRSGSFATRHVQSLIGNRSELTHEDTLFGLPIKSVGGVDVSWNDQTRYPSLESSANLVSTEFPYGFATGDYGMTRFASGIGPTGPIAEARGKLRTIALFNENRLSLTPQLVLVTGVRWEDVEYSRINYRLPSAPTLANPFGDPAFFGKGYQPFTWRTALMYDLTKTENVYVTYSTAADPANNGVLLTNNAAGVRNFDLTTGQQIEAGAKFDFLDGMGSATLAGYFIERKNVLTPDPDNPGNFLAVGKQSSNGVEANVGLQLTDTLSLQGNAAWVNPKFDKFDETVSIGGRTINVSRAGNRPTNIARWIANGWLTWKFLPDWSFLFSSRYVGDRFANNANTIRVPAYVTFDTALSWTIRPDAALTARLRNIANTPWVEWATGTPHFIIGRPRTFEMELSMKF
jgi:iron complex outermembrane receptor protein